MIRALIIDDEQAGINTLSLLMARYESLIRVVASTTNSAEGIELIEDYRPDVVFLDISMPNMSGFELLNRVSYKEFKLVFTTAHQEYAIQAIKSKAFDYLLKPIDPDDFKQCVENLAQLPASAHTKPASKKLVELQVRDGIIYIRQSEIIRLEASRSYTEFYLDGGIKHVASKNLKEYEAILDEKIFYRCHNSHIVNLLKVKKFVNHEGLFALMNDGSMADISKKQKDLFLERLKAL
jgi:two-component system, LytTR family, response regulator